MLRHDSSRSADRNRVLMQGTAAAVNAPDGAGASFRAADNAALRDAAKSEAIKLDLYHLVWIFAVCSVLGLVGETVVSYFVDGRWENRAGFLWGPFSPIYGVGGVVMTLALASWAATSRERCCSAPSSAWPAACCSAWRLLSGLRSSGSPDGSGRTRSALWPGIILRNRSIWAGIRVWASRLCGELPVWRG